MDRDGSKKKYICVLNWLELTQICQPWKPYYIILSMCGRLLYVTLFITNQKLSWFVKLKNHGSCIKNDTFKWKSGSLCIDYAKEPLIWFQHVKADLRCLYYHRFSDFYAEQIILLWSYDVEVCHADLVRAGYLNFAAGGQKMNCRIFAGWKL